MSEYRLGELPLGLLLMAMLVGWGGIGCQEGPKVGAMGEAIDVKGMQVKVEGYDVRHLEVIDGKRTHEYDKPALAFRVSFKNTGKEAFRYTPTHDASQMTESTTPLLYSDPGKGKPLPPKDKTPINGVVLKKGKLGDQVTQSTKIAPGESLTDVFLFEVPGDKQANFIFSVPPSMHPGNKPILFRVSYKYQKPDGPTWHAMGDTANVDGVGFTVKSAEVAYIKTKHTTDGKGFSSDPVLKITYEIANDGDEEVSYTPGHSAVSGRRGASLSGSDERFARVRFSSNTTVVGQKSESTPIKPGKSVEDFVLFERPGKDVKVLKFEYPASRFGRAGLLRYNLPYEYEDPEKPEPLKGKDDDEDDEE